MIHNTFRFLNGMLFCGALLFCSHSMADTIDISNADDDAQLFEKDAPTEHSDALKSSDSRESPSTQKQEKQPAKAPSEDDEIDRILMLDRPTETVEDLPPLAENEDDDFALRKAVKRKEFIEDKAGAVPFLLLPHRPNYIMPITYQFLPNDQPFADVLGDEWPGLNHEEAVFQISVKYQIARLTPDNSNRLYVAYTNKSHWQVYNDRTSRPFRETNHEPEIMAVFTPDWGYIDRVYLSLNHQSNGQYTGLSRSWNRIMLGMFHITGNMVVGVAPWWRIPETQKADPEDPSDNDNPDIDDYMGYGEFIFMRMVGQRSLSIKVRNNLRTDHNNGSIELDWSFPITPRVKGFVQYFEGYGESLIEYDHYQKRLGFGFKISDYL